ncbi:MAG: transcriptional regulator [Armatimonadetes bacterium]|nr:transcriptional regulator [Armatimonadota bacterium]
MSSVVSMRLKEDQIARLKRYARTLGKTPGETGAILIEEKLREAEFAFVEFRSTAAGRIAFMKGSRLPVWWVIHVARSFDMDAGRAAEHFRKPSAWVQAAILYEEAYPEEIDQDIDSYLASDFRTLRRMLPHAQSFTVTLGDES